MPNRVPPARMVLWRSHLLQIDSLIQRICDGVRSEGKERLFVSPPSSHLTTRHLERKRL